MTEKIIISSDVSKDLGTLIAERIEASNNDEFVIGVSGGSLPKFFASGVSGLKIDWKKVKFFFCDERLVPFDNGDSTFKAYKELLVDDGAFEGITEKSFILVNVGLPAEEAARDYEAKIKGYAVKGFDMLLLGMGPDGHTCSLFPNHPLLNEQTAIVAPIVDSPKPPPSRVTLTLPYINKAKTVVFVSTGEGKKVMVENVVKKKMNEFPASRVKPETGDLYWILDKPAASNL